MRARRLGATAGMAMALAMTVPASASGSTAVSGRWVDTLPCLGIALPISGAFHCAGSSHWDGTWTGSTRYVADGAVSLITGDAHGTVNETFQGWTPKGTHGRLLLGERFVVRGATHRVHREFEVIDSGGGLARSYGSGSFEGTAAGPMAMGTYRGKWGDRGRRHQSHGQGGQS
jgi:hypothetical protein